MDFASSPWLWDSGIPRPTFERDFARDKELDRGGTGPAITFTRASNATFFNASGTLQTAANDAPRFDHDPANGASSLGLLIEEARTNLLTRSAEIDNAAWTKLGGTITANSDTAPDGTTTADKFVESNASETHQIFQTVTGVAAIQTASFFVKAAGRTSCQFLAFNLTDDSVGRVNVDLTNGSTSSVIGTATSTSVGNGWYRVSVIYTPTVTNTSFNIFPRDGSGNTTYLGNGTDGILVWGAQLEQGAFPTSYIPTTTAAATRSADSAVVTPISSFYNQSEGTLFAEFSRPQVNNSGQVVFVRSAANANRHTTISTSSTNGAQRFIARDSAEQIIAQLNVNSNTANTVYKAAAGLRNDDFGYSQNGAAVLTDTSGTIDTGYDRVDIGSFGTVQQLNGHIRKVAYWPKRLTNTLLQQLTT